MVRLALADHLDITFQEARLVRIRRDAVAPDSRAHMEVKVHTSRLDVNQGSSLLASFLTNASIASEMLGLTVNEIAHVDDSQGPGSNEKTSKVMTDAADLPEENADEYAEHYSPLATEAEQQTNKNSASIAGVDVPESVPVPVIVGAAVAVVTFLAAVGVWLNYRRRQLSMRNASDNTVVKVVKEDDIVIEPTKDVA